ncbi:hypothetical protein BGZ94_007311 [Podila epigama]|nr:hypothetical protein BGZ94_007311 [Podila epigama]
MVQLGLDSVNFQGMPRIALTATEEALVPRPPSTASQVATAVPLTYTRFGSTHSLSSAPLSHPHSRHPPPLSPAEHQAGHSSTINSAGQNEQEYPQNPQDPYYGYSTHSSPFRHGSASHSLDSLHRHSQNQCQSQSQSRQNSWGSNMRMDQRNTFHDSDDDDEDDDEDDNGEMSRETDSSKEGLPRSTPKRTQRHHRHSFHQKRPQPRHSADVIRQLKKSTAKLSFREAEGTKQEGGSDGLARSPAAFGAKSHHSLYASNQSAAEMSPSSHLSERKSLEWSDDDRSFPQPLFPFPEPRRTRTAWRPSLSLIRQESSVHGMYPQHDKTDLRDTIPDTGNAKVHDDVSKMPKRIKLSKKAQKKEKDKQKRKTKRIVRENQPQVSEKEVRSHNVVVMPNLQQVLDKKTHYPLGYDDFEAFLRTQRAVEYLNFWVVSFNVTSR